MLECLAKRPGERPRSADVIAERLSTMTLAHPRRGQRAADWWARPRPDARNEPAPQAG